MSSFLPNTPRLRRGLAGLDCLALGLSAWLAHVVRFSSPLRQAKLTGVLSHPGFIVVGVAAMLALATAAELYEPLALRRRTELVARVVMVSATWAGVVILATYMVPEWKFGRGLMMLTAVSWGALALAARSAMVRWMRKRPRAAALVVGDRSAVELACGRLQTHPLSVWSPVSGAGLPPEKVAAAARAFSAELVILVGGEQAPVEQLAALHFSGVPVVAASEIWAWLDARLPLDDLVPSSFLHQPGFGAVHWKLFNRLTRVLDVVLAGVALVLTAPLLAVASIVVRVADGSPVLYRQVRVGQHGRTFTLLKLRTMKRNAEEDGPAFAQPGDPRVTRTGRILRRLRLDELPQLANVLRGEMSMVGPRPERPEFVAELSASVPYYGFRLAVPPGLTGWAQVNMPYARTLEAHRLRLEYDLYFIRERSVNLYVLTLLRTINAAIAGTGT